MVSTEAGIEGDQRVCRWQVACDELGALARTRGNEPRDRPALGLGSRVVRSYAECAGRVARLAASLRQRFGLEAGERVAIVAKNSPDYLELMFGIWHQDWQRCPPTPSCMAASSPISWSTLGPASASRRTESIPRSLRHAPATLEHLITIGGAEYEALFATGAPVEVWPCRGTDLASLFDLRNHRPAEGRHAHPRHARGPELAYAAEVDADRAGRRAPAWRADEPRIRRLHHRVP